MASASLDGVVVLDAATLYPAPLLAACLGDLGAEVIKLEPPAGDPLRHLPHGELLWSSVARHKKSITLDLEREVGRALYRRLIPLVDVLVENFPARALERWSLDWDALSELHPGLVMASVSAWGRSGPDRHRPGNGSLVEARSGAAHLTGSPGGPPLLASYALGDGVAAMWGVGQVLAALYGRDAKGQAGSHVDVCMLDAMRGLLEPSLARAAAGEPPVRSGSRIPGVEVRDVFRTADDTWLAVSAVTPRQHQKLSAVLGATGSPQALAMATERWLADRTRAQALEAFDRAGVAAAPVNDLETVIRERGAVASGPAPALGEHNAAIWAGRVGLERAQLDALREAGVI